MCNLYSQTKSQDAMRQLFNPVLEEDEELIDINPFPNLKKIQGTESPRDKVLKDSEIKAIWTALERESPNMRDIMRLLLLLGQRGPAMSRARRPCSRSGSVRGSR